MKLRVLFLLLFACAAFSCKPLMPKGGWSDECYGKICSLIRECGSSSKDYDPSCKPYAVFDLDNTTVIGDTEIALMHYQIANLRYVIAPSDFYRYLTEGLSDISLAIHKDKTAEMLASDIAEDYAVLYDKYISRFPDPKTPEAVDAFKAVCETDEYKDFCAKMSAMATGVDDFCSYAETVIFYLKPLAGMTYGQVRALTKESCDYWSAMDGVRQVTWTSPDKGRCGVVASTHPEGYHVPAEMTSLYKALNDNGFDVYVCSASLQAVVEAVACDPAYGFCLEPGQVFGTRLKDSDLGIVLPEFDENWTKTFMEGKTACIKASIAPSHGGKGPVLVGGDSNGDYFMLTDFPDMRLGLIIDTGAGGKIGELSRSADPRYILQPRDLPAGKFCRDHKN